MNNKINDYYKKLSEPKKAAVWFAICGFFRKGIQFVTTPVFTRILSTEQFGRVSVYLSWYNIVTIFLTLNLYLGSFNNGMTNNETKRDEYMSSMQGLVVCISAVVYCFYLFTHSFWNNLLEMNTPMVSIMFAEILVYSSLAFFSARERYEYRYKKLVLYTMLAVTLPSVISIFAILIAPKSYGAEVKIYANAIVSIMICVPILLKNFLTGKKFFNKEFWIFGLSFNIPLIPHYLAGIFLNQIDRIMIQKMIGLSEAGIYSLAYSASMVLNVVTTSINQSFAPWLYKKLKEGSYEYISKKSNRIFLGVAIMVAVFVILAPECIIFFGGEKYAEAVGIIPAVSTSLYFNFIFQILANVEFYYMHNKYISIASVTGAILNVVLNYYAIEKYGYLAAGYTTLICYVIFALCHSCFVYGISKKDVGYIKLFDYKTIWLIGFMLIIINQTIILLYKLVFIRYCLLIVVFFIAIMYRKKIINLIGGEEK